MMRFGGTPGTLSASGLDGLVVASSSGPYEAHVTGTMPTNKITYQPGTLDIYDTDGRLVYSHAPQFRGRGNSTWDAPKKPFKVRSADRQQKPFGLPASRDWALMADYFDPSYIRSTVAFHIARRATGRWAPHSKHVRLTWNGAYQGFYRYSETADVQVGRVDIRKMADTDTTGSALTGPYYLETNHPLDDDGWRTTRGNSILYDTPDVVAVPEQVAYIQGWVDTLETALMTGTEGDILPLIDVPSWVDWYLCAELMKNADSNWFKSCKWFKDQDAPNGTGKAVLWPLWDFDRCLGAWGDLFVPGPTGFHVRADQESPVHGPNWLWWVWEKSPVFRAAVREAWEERFAPTVADIWAFMDRQAASVAPFQAEDRAKWFAGSALPYNSEIEWMKTWLETRAAWITANL